MKKIKYIFLVLITAFVSCDKRSTERGHSFLPDMEKSRAYDTYGENPNFSDSMTMRMPVKGTVPRNIKPFLLTKSDEDLLIAGKTIHNPFTTSLPEHIERGKLQYKRFCAHCHGDKGDGQGFLYTSKKYVFPPANLQLEKTINRPDGELFHIISVGYKIMGAHGTQISQDDRWKIVLYIRELQKPEKNP